MRFGPIGAMAGAALAASASPALAHAADRGFVLLLPTGHYLLGGALAVLISFAVLALVDPARVAGWFDMRLRLGRMPASGRAVVSLASFIFLAALVAVGLTGSADPLSNPLPLVIWTLFWVGLTLLHGLFGNLWSWLNPWHGPYRIAVALGWRAPSRLPEAAGHWIAVAGLLAFGWFELVDPAPDNPTRLAVVVAAYWAFAFAGMLVFGERDWTLRAEPFSLFFSMIARLAPLSVAAGEGALRCPPVGGSICDCRVRLHLPGAAAVHARVLKPGATLFLLLALSTVSFDGLMRTFFWLGTIGINPLEFPGRSAVIVPNSIGLVAMWVVLAGVFYLAVWLGARLAGTVTPMRELAGRLVWSILPIALAYHFSHYLVSFVINAQYALAALSDPLSNGANLFGTAGMHVQAGATMGAERAWLIWNAQSAAIIGGHMLAVLLAHVIAYRTLGNARQAALSQLPLAALMVAYTVFGLWLLSSPTGG